MKTRAPIRSEDYCAFISRTVFSLVICVKAALVLPEMESLITAGFDRRAAPYRCNGVLCGAIGTQDQRLLSKREKDFRDH